MKCFYQHILFCLFLLTSGWINATHIVGGEINYEYIGNNTYRITLTVFRDCGPTNVKGTNFDEVAQVGFYELNEETYYTSLSIPLASSNVEYVPVFLANPCFLLPPDVCVERAVYVEEVFLPFNASGYIAIYQRCCRNPSIVNLDFPNGNGTTVYTTIPGTDLVNNQNNDAYFNNYPPVALCRDAEFFFDHSATDEDGDSLSYTLCSPMHGGSQENPAPSPPEGPPYFEVSWASGYDWDYPLDADPVFAIDSSTGYMTGIAIQNGQYVIGVCVNEYRDGVLINSSIRDFQFNVTTCDPNIVAATMDPITACANETIQFQNESTNASTFSWDFGVPNSTLDVSTLFEPTFAYTEAGNFSVQVIANPGWFCADTAYTSVNIPTAILPEIIIGTYECVNDNDVYQFGSTSNGSTSANYAWDFGAGSIPQFSTAAQPGAVQLNPEVVVANISLQVSDLGCVETEEVTIDNPPDPIASIGPQITFCNGYDYEFQNLSQNATDYLWNFGTIGTGDVSNLISPVFTYPDTGQFVVTLIATAPFTCPDETQTSIDIYGELNSFFEAQSPQCFLTNQFDFQATGASTSNAVYAWTFENGTPASSSQQVQQVQFVEPGMQTVALTIMENGCTVVHTDSVWVVAEFENSVILNPVEGCPGQAINLQIVSESVVPVYYIWNMDDGSIKYAPAFTHTYLEPGAYTISVEAYTNFGCVQSETITIPNAVIIHPAATASFTANPSIISILDPGISIVNTSPDAVSCLYVMSDGNSMEDCNGVYAFSEAGVHTITQYVVNEWGCGTSVSGTVVVRGFLFFAPNAFTPDGDGLNDVWWPQMTGVEAIDVQIFNRWGELCYNTKDLNTPWLGQARNDSNHFAPNGIYQYRIKAQDLTGEVHEFKGTISLVR